MQIFYINQYSLNPVLRMELINDGKYDFLKSYQFNNAIQNADVRFTMKEADSCKLKISKAPAIITLGIDDTCEERYILEYHWQKRDTNEKGQYLGRFEILFKNDLKEEGVKYPEGNLIVPIFEDLTIFVK